MDESVEALTFESEGVVLRASLYRTTGRAAPVVVMAHGFTGVAAQLTPQARTLAAAGFNVLLFDHPGFGRSGGYPRQEVDPVRQMRGYRDAISLARRLAGVDPARIGLWGSSLSGGHVLQVAALDPRVGAVVAQVPFISGGLLQAGMDKMRVRLMAEREARGAGDLPQMIPVTASDDSFCALPGADAHAYFNADPADGWLNTVTFSSFEMIGGHEPAWWIGQIAPRPLLMLVAKEDRITPHDHALEAFARAGEPKTLVRLPVGHFACYSGEGFDTAMAAAIALYRSAFSAD